MYFVPFSHLLSNQIQLRFIHVNHQTNLGCSVQQAWDVPSPLSTSDSEIIKREEFMLKKSFQFLGVVGFFGIITTAGLLGTIAHGVKNLCSKS
jgi:hypothetical protein